MDLWYESRSFSLSKAFFETDACISDALSLLEDKIL